VIFLNGIGGAEQAGCSLPAGAADPTWIPDGFEAEHFCCRDYTISREDSPGLRGGGLSPRRVSATDADSHSRQSPAALRARILHCRDYRPPNWFSHSGVRKKRRLIELRGLPRFHQWRFITLTFRRADIALANDEENFELDPEAEEWGPLSAYLAGKDHMRRFLYACRQNGLWSDDAAWAWKMEFHADGWVHWHLLVERTAKMTVAEMATLTRLWGFGRVRVDMVRQDDFLYSFKYAFKAVSQADGEDHDNGAAVAPAWFLDYYGSRTVTVKWTDADGIEQSERVTKPISFSRVRFWQTSKGFYTKALEKVERERKPQASWSVPLPVRAHADRIAAQVQVIARDVGGNYQQSAVFPLSCSKDEFWNLAAWHFLHGGAVGLAIGSYCVPAFLLESKIENTCQLRPLIHRNRLSLPSATRLAQRRQTLLTC
jgi:hypothetical protein